MSAETNRANKWWYNYIQEFIVKPNQIKLKQQKMNEKQSHLEDAPGFKDGREINPPCRDKEHSAPVMICVPYGKMYVHYCPACGYKSTVMGSTATL